MRAFIYNILLTVFWVAVTESFTLENFLVGFGLSLLILLLARSLFTPADGRYFALAWKLPRFAALMLWEVILSSVKVARAVLSRDMGIKPGIIAFPLEAKTDVEITLLANLITLTPGTLSLDVSDDRRVIFIHGMFADDPQAVIEGTRNSLEKAVLEVTR